MAGEFPRRVAVIGAAGGLGGAVLGVCRAEGVEFCAVVRSRPERIAETPGGSRIAVVASLADQEGLTAAFDGAEAVITAVGVTRSSADETAMASRHMETLEAAMQAAGVERILLINTLLAGAPGEPAPLAMRFFSWFPGRIGLGAREQQATVDALGRGALSTRRWTLVRAAVNAAGKDEPPVASTTWDAATLSMLPVSYAAMARWMLREAAAGAFVRAAPYVARRRRREPAS